MKKATREHTKEHNKRLVLSILLSRRQVSRADIARSTQLTRTTVSSVINELIEDGLVKEIGRGKSAVGKRPILLKVVDNSRHLIGIDLADSEFRGGLVELNGNIINREKIPIYDKDGEDALEIVYKLIDKLVAASTSPLLGIGIGTPGLIDTRNGKVRSAINLNWQDLPLLNILQERYSLNVYIANDCQVAALAEYTFRYKRAIQNMIVVRVGRGVGAGIVLNGHLYNGDGFGAGEIGHIKIIENGERCVCGNYGCLETVVSNRAIYRSAKKAVKRLPQSILQQYANTESGINYDIILEAVNSGDDSAQKIIANVGRYLGIALADLVSILNIHHITIGGKISRLGEALLQTIGKEMRNRSMPTLSEKTNIIFSNMGEDIIIRGAAALLMANELH